MKYMADYVLEVENLTKNFGSFCAVNKISFNIPRGKVVGLLGPNGAGKTTTINMLLAQILPNSGNIKYFGKDFLKNREYCFQRINYASSYKTLQGRISVWENLLVFANLYGLKNPKKKVDELAEYFQITDLLPIQFWNLSSGQKTRVSLIKSLINDPELILMDEPTASLDPDVGDKTLALIEDLKASRKISILYTSHRMSEITRICDEVIFLDHGTIIAQDTPLALTKKITNTKLKLTFDGNKEVIEKYLKAQGQSFVFPTKNIVYINTEEKMVPLLIFEIKDQKVEIVDIEIEKPTLEDVFLQIARGDNNVITEN